MNKKEGASCITTHLLCFSMQYIRNSPVLGRLLLEKGKYEYKQIVCGYSYYVISC